MSIEDIILQLTLFLSSDETMIQKSITNLESLRKNLHAMVKAKSPPIIRNEISPQKIIKNEISLQKIAYDALLALTELSPLNDRDQYSQLLCPISHSPIEENKKLFLSTGYIYDINYLTSWVAIRRTNPLSGELLSNRELEHIQSVVDYKRKIILAVEHNNSEMVKTLLADRGIDPNQTNNAGETALFIAVKRKNLLIVQILLADARTDVNQAETEGGRTPLFVAARDGYLDIVRALLGVNNIKVNEGQVTGATAFMMAAQKGHLNVMHALLNAGMNPNQATHNGRSALFFAVKHNKIDAVNMLLAIKGINANQALMGGRTPLTVAITLDYNDIVHVLLKHHLNRMIEEPALMQEAFIYNSRLLDDLAGNCPKLWMLLQKFANVHLDFDAHIALFNVIYESKKETNIINQHPLYTVFAKQASIEDIGKVVRASESMASSRTNNLAFFPLSREKLSDLLKDNKLINKSI